MKNDTHRWRSLRPPPWRWCCPRAAAATASGGSSSSSGGSDAAAHERGDRQGLQPVRHEGRHAPVRATPATGTRSTRPTPTTAYSWNFIRLYGRSLVDVQVGAGQGRRARWCPTSPRRSACPATTPRPGPTRCARASSTRTARRSRPRTSSTPSSARWTRTTFPQRPDVLQRLPRPAGLHQSLQGHDPDKLGLKAIETPDDKTIVFHLKTAVRRLRLLRPAAGDRSRCRRPRTPARSTRSTSVSTGPYKFDDQRARQELRAGPQPELGPGDRPRSGRKALPDKIDGRAERQRRRHRQPAAVR